MRATDKSLRKEQARYKRNFDARLCKPKYDIPVESYVFLREEQGTATEPKHKLEQVATGPYAVKQSDRTTVVIAIGEQEERVSRDRVELAPSPMEQAPTSGLHQVLQYLSGHETEKLCDEPESEESPHAQTQTQEDEGNLVRHNSSAEIRQDRQEIISSEELEQSEDPQEGEVSNPGRGEEETDAEYVIEKIIDHGYQDEEFLLQVKWYGYETKDAT